MQYFDRFLPASSTALWLPVCSELREMAVRSSSVPSSTIPRVTAEFGVRSEAWRGAVLRRDRRVFTSGVNAVEL